MIFKKIKVKTYTVIISEGGVSVIDGKADYTSCTIEPPKNIEKMTGKQLKTLANKVVKEYEKMIKV
jgi:hypothetical protein